MDVSMCLLQARPLSTEIPSPSPPLSLSSPPSLSLSLSKPSIWPRSSVHLARFLHPPAALRRTQHRSQPHPLLAMANDAIAATTVASSRKSIAQTFSDLKLQGKVALIPYLTAGDPDLSTTAEAIKVLDDNGADIIELGVPYSDPLADGPVIQAAATRALHNGADLDHILEMLTKVVPNLRAPVVLFTYYNPILRRGANEFIQTIKQVGVTGLVVPDLPLEETELLRKLTAENNLELVLLTTPTTPIGRMKQIAQASQGFVYLVSLTGVTGARASVEARVEGLLQELKKATEKPVAVGFGISKPEHAAQMAKWGADGVIVGSAMVKLLYEASSPQEGLAALKIFTRDLKAALP